MTAVERPDRRAKDADRLATVETIEAAARDGQLTPAEVEERLFHARTAVTIGELDGLTPDLQPVVEAAPARRSRRRARIAAGVVVVLVAAGAGYFLTHRDDAPSSAPARHAPAQPAPAEEDVADPAPVQPAKPPVYAFTARGVRNFITLYQQEFDRPPRALAFGFSRTQVVIYQPSESTGTVHRWFLREGRFLDDGPESPAAPVEKGVFDLRRVDLPAMFAHVRKARTEAERVNRKAGRRVDILGVSILRENGRPRIYVSAGNRSSNACYRITTDLAGKVLDEGSERCE